MNKVSNILIIAFTIVAFSACSGTQELSRSPGAIQGDWTLATMDGENVEMGSEYTLSFNTDGTVAGLAGCNYYVTGEYNAQEEGQLSLNAIASTNISCESKSMDDNFVSAIESASSFEVRQGNTLVLNPGSSPQVTFNKVMQENEEG